MSTGYEIVRCVRDKSLHVIFRVGEFRKPTGVDSLIWVRGRAFPEALWRA
jgi:hypothetical protein